MKYFLLTLVSIISFSSFAQTDNFKRFQVGVNFSPDVAYRLLVVGKGANIPPSFTKNWDTIEIPKFGYTAGINFCYNIKSFVGIEVGVQYSNKGFQSKKQDLLDSIYIDNNGQLGASYIAFKYVYDFHYIDIPVKVNFTVGKKKVRFFTSVGLITNVLVHVSSTAMWTKNGTYHKDTQKSTENFNRVNLSPILSFGLDYKINNKMNLRMEPTIRFGIMSVVDGYINGYLYNGGLNISYYFGL